MTMASAIQQMIIYPQMGRGQSHVTVFLFLLIFHICGLGDARHIKCGITQVDHGYIHHVISSAHRAYVNITVLSTDSVQLLQFVN